MKNKRFFSFLLALALVCSLVCTVSAKEASWLHVIGSQYTVDSSDLQETNGDFDKSIGDRITLNYTGDDFLYWVNISGNIVSTSKSYSFVLVGETTIKLITSRRAAGDSSASAYVVFMNAYRQVLSAQRIQDEFDAEDALPKNNPSKMGATFLKWVFEGTETEATPAAIASKASTGNTVVKVVPLYDVSDEAYTVNVKVKKNGTTTPVADFTGVSVPAGQLKTFRISEIAEAAGMDTADFSFWSLDGITADSYNPNYYTLAAKGTTIDLVAVFDGEVEAKPTISIVEMYGMQADPVYKICTTMRWYAPTGFTVQDSGFVFSTDSSFAGNPDALVLGADKTNSHVSGYTEPEGFYTFFGSVGTDTAKTVYIKAFLRYTDSQGNVVTIYSDMRSGSYQSLTN